MMRDRLTAVKRFAPAAVVVMLTAALPHFVSAQTPAQPQTTQPQSAQPTPTPQNSRDSRAQGADESNADLSITGRVTADSLRFEKVPNTRVEFTGRPARDTVWEAERTNLPEQVQPGVTYRDIGITLRITSVFADIDRIVAEALGEVPLNEESRPAPSTPERPAAAPASPQGSITPPANATANDRRRRPARRGRAN